MTVGVVWNADPPMRSLSLGLAAYARGFAANGHAVKVFARNDTGDGFELPTVPFTPEQAADPGFWKSHQLSAAFLVTWLGMCPVLSALREAGAKTLAFCDTDGLIGYRLHPRANLRRMIVYHRDWLTKARCVKFWLQKVLFHSPAMDAEMVRSADLSDLAILSNPETERLVRWFFSHHGRPDLHKRTVAIPPPVHERFCAGSPPAGKKPLFVAVGRWDDPAKHAELLAAALDRYYTTGGSYETVIAGPGEDVFQEVAARHPKLSAVGRVPPERVVELLRDARGILFSSRWEGGPNAANEMLAMGGTVIAPPLPSLIGVTENGRFGRIAPRRGPGHLADAMHAEAAAWDAGKRDSVMIAEHWRAVLNPTAVCRRILDAAGVPA